MRSPVGSVSSAYGARVARLRSVVLCAHATGRPCLPLYAVVTPRAGGRTARPFGSRLGGHRHGARAERSEQCAPPAARDPAGARGSGGEGAVAGRPCAGEDAPGYGRSLNSIPNGRNCERRSRVRRRHSLSARCASRVPRPTLTGAWEPIGPTRKRVCAIGPLCRGYPRCHDDRTHERLRDGCKGTPGVLPEGGGWHLRHRAGRESSRRRRHTRGPRRPGAPTTELFPYLLPPPAPLLSPAVFAPAPTRAAFTIPRLPRIAAVPGVTSVASVTSVTDCRRAGRYIRCIRYIRCRLPPCRALTEYSSGLRTSRQQWGSSGKLPIRRSDGLSSEIGSVLDSLR